MYRTQCKALEVRLVGPMVKTSASRAADKGFESRSRGDFFGSSHTSDLQIDTPVATLPGVWRYGGQRWDWLAWCQYSVTAG